MPKTRNLRTKTGASHEPATSRIRWQSIHYEIQIHSEQNFKNKQ